jgi:hypothetical protein
MIFLGRDSRERSDPLFLAGDSESIPTGFDSLGLALKAEEMLAWPPSNSSLTIASA